MRTKVVVTAVLAAAVLSVTSVTGATASASAGTNVLVVMNPSTHAIKNEVRHVKQVFGQVSSLPQLWFFGIYEQRSSDDGAPFDRPFVVTQTPPAVRPLPLDPCRETQGTPDEQSECKKKHEGTRAENAAIKHNILATWRSQTLGQIERAGRSTEESKRWDLAGTLARAGLDLRSLSPGGSRQNCLVLLGGLAVHPPPSNVDLSMLKGAKIIVTGWRSTPQVQTLWTTHMQKAGAGIEFLPADVTDFMLKDAVTRCTAPT
jgi:hypothetical protein